MTEEEKDRLRAAKQEITARLATEDYDRYRLSEVDPRLDEYVRSVASDPEGHNLYEQLGVGRFLDMCERYGVNLSEVRQFYDFYESLYFPGKNGLQQYRLTPVQAFQFAGIFAFWDNGRRVVREAVLYVPRKFSKTTGTATLPYILYRRSALMPSPLKSGQAETVEIELMCYTERYTEGVALAEAVRSALDGRQTQLAGLVMRSCYLSSSEEYWADDAFVQQLTFTIKI